MGICVHIEIQKGKLVMARNKFHRDYGATTGCTVRLCHALNMSEHAEVPPQPVVCLLTVGLPLSKRSWLCGRNLESTSLAP
jgi:hypothetical protein